ncbi:MAG TPA: helix-turn-helix domain-containing protein [Ktedonobacteraceae bacterium]|nr:helix-turn-helix domain-containing protein [Ktedonobacteraceae bacterium]
MTTEHQRIIDLVLRVVSSRTTELAMMTKYVPKDDAEIDTSKENLRQSMLGYHLARIARYAEYEEDVSAENAQESISTVLKLIFRNPFQDSSQPPVGFHRSELGQLMNEAYTRMVNIADLISPTDAYRLLGVSRQSVYDMIEDARLTPIYVGGKTMLKVQQVEQLKAQRSERRRERQTSP